MKPIRWWNLFHLSQRWFALDPGRSYAIVDILSMTKETNRLDENDVIKKYILYRNSRATVEVAVVTKLRSKMPERLIAAIQY